jgi:hypothetical protein
MTNTKPLEATGFVGMEKPLVIPDIPLEQVSPSQSPKVTNSGAQSGTQSTEEVVTPPTNVSSSTPREEDSQYDITDGSMSLDESHERIGMKYSEHY